MVGQCWSISRKTSIRFGGLLVMTSLGLLVMTSLALAAAACSSSSSTTTPTKPTGTANVAAAASLSYLSEKVVGPSFTKEPR